MTRLTKAQLQERVEELERQLAEVKNGDLHIHVDVDRRELALKDFRR